MIPSDPVAGGKVLEKILNFQIFFFAENDALECVYYFSCTNKFDSMP